MISMRPRGRLYRQRLGQLGRSMTVAEGAMNVPKEVVPKVTAKKGTFKHFAQSIGRFQALRNRHMRAADARLGRRSLGRGEHQLSWDGVEILGVPVVYFQIVLILIIGVVALVVIFTDAQTGRRSYRGASHDPSKYHYSRHALEALAIISNNKRCNMDIYDVTNFTRDIFTTRYYNSRPVIVQLNESHQEVLGSNKLQIASLYEDYGTWAVHAPVTPQAFSQLHHLPTLTTVTMETFLRDHLHNDDPRNLRCVEDKPFIKSSKIVPIKELQALAFEHRTDTESELYVCGAGGDKGFYCSPGGWLYVVHGSLRLFLYPLKQPPPAGVGSGFNISTWARMVYPQLDEQNKPTECLISNGTLVHIPAGMYVAWVNLEDTVAVILERTSFSDNNVQLYIQELWSASHPEHVPLLTKLTNDIPDNSDIWRRLAEAQLLQGDGQQAMASAVRAIQLDPLSSGAVLVLARALAHTGHINLALEKFESALLLNPTDAMIYLYQGELLEQRRKHWKAITVYEQGTANCPYQEELWRRLYRAQRHGGAHPTKIQETLQNMRRLGIQ